MIRRFMSAVVLMVTGLVVLPAVTVTANHPTPHPEIIRPATSADLAALQGCDGPASVTLDGKNSTITVATGNRVDLGRDSLLPGIATSKTPLGWHWWSQNGRPSGWETRIEDRLTDAHNGNWADQGSYCAGSYGMYLTHDEWARAYRESGFCDTSRVPTARVLVLRPSVKH